MSTLPTNYVDAVLNAEVNTRRKFNLINNGDGTVSLEDVTDYTTVGSNYGAADINNQNTEINQINNDLTNLIQYTPLLLTTDAQGNAILPSTYKLGFQAGTRQVISVHVNGNLVTCSNCGLTENNTPFVTCHNYNDTIYASKAVNLMVLYMQH